MPHDAETWIIDKTDLPGRTCIRTKLSDGTTTRSNYASNTRSGEKIWGHRAASTKSSPDSSGWRPPKPYDGYLMTTNVGVSDMTVRGLLYQNTMTNVPVVANWPESAWLYLTDSSKEELCRQKALQRFSSKTIDLSVAFAERKKTANMLSSAARDIIKLAIKLRKGEIGTVFRRVSRDDFAKRWLEHRYGWTPLLGDVYGAAEAIARKDTGYYSRYRVTARQYVDLEQVNVARATGQPLCCSGTNCAQGYTDMYAERRINTRYKVRFDAILSSSSYLRLQDVGVTDPMSTAWELLPFSFVVDWFLGVGDWLGAVNALQAYTFKGGCSTRYTSWSQKVVRTGVTVGNTQTTFYGEYNSAGTNFVRSVISSSPGSIVLKKNPLNLVRTLDSLALLSQAFGRSVRRGV